MSALRLAVASKDGVLISEHFGHAKEFHIYESNGEQCRLLERRQVSHYCLGGHSDKSAFPAIVEAIGDCRAVFVAKIGDGPREKLAARDIEAVDAYSYEEIEPSLNEYAARHVADIHPAADWALTEQAAGRFNQSDIDCTTAVVLKILDNKCKMSEGEKRAIVEIYRVVRPGTHTVFTSDTHDDIDRMLQQSDEATAAEIHRWRVHGEATIDKPVMKAYKAVLRNGLFGE